MKSNKYIVSQIDKLSKSFPYVKFSYQMDELSETHFIEVLPKDYFEKYEIDFVKQQNKIILDFIKKFPEEGLAFITEDDLFSVDRPEYIKCGRKYENLEQNLSWNHENLNELLKKFTPDIQNSFIVDHNIHEVKQNSTMCSFSLKTSNEKIEFQIITHNLPSESSNSTASTPYDVANETDYFLAA